MDVSFPSALMGFEWCVIRPRSTSSWCFQKPNVQCALYDANPPSMPLYMNVGCPHFTVSSTSGHASCTTARMWVRIGCANVGDFLMYASIRGSVFGMPGFYGVCDAAGSG